MRAEGAWQACLAPTQSGNFLQRRIGQLICLRKILRRDKSGLV